MAARWSTRGISGQNGLTEPHVAVLPREWKIAAPPSRRGALCAHGSAGSSLSALTVGAVSQVANALVDADIPVLSGDNGGPTTWGNDTCITKVGESVASLNTAFGAKADKALLAATSMGTPCLLNWARTNLSKVAAIALMVPCVDIADVHDNSVPSFTAEIEAAFTNFAGYTAALPTHNPAAFAAVFAGIPTTLYVSTDDPVARLAPAQAFAAAVGSSASVVSIGANGHGFGSWDPAAAANFLAQYA